MATEDNPASRTEGEVQSTARALSRAVVRIGVFGAIFTASAFVMAPDAGLSVGAGGLAAVVHFAGVAYTVRVLLGQSQAPLPWFALALFKFLLLGGVLFWLVKNEWVSLLPLLAGYAALPLGVVAQGLERPTPAFDSKPAARPLYPPR